MLWKVVGGSQERALCVGVVWCGVWEDEALEVWIEAGWKLHRRLMSSQGHRASTEQAACDTRAPLTAQPLN